MIERTTIQVIFALVLLITGNLSLRLVVSLITGNHPSVCTTSSRGLEGGGSSAHMAKLGRVELVKLSGVMTIEVELEL